MNTATIANVLEIIEGLAPTDEALPEDPVGLQCGDTARPARKIMIALDAATATVQQAVASGVDLLVTHHPLLYEPLSPGNLQGPPGKAFVKAVQGGLAVYSAHTNLDASPEGINASLADIVDLRERKILLPTGPSLYKVVVFVPESFLGQVREAIFGAGGGRIGHYSRCSFAAAGEGTFMGDETTLPAIGYAGREEIVGEARLEVLVPEKKLSSVLEAARKIHPYETPVIDVFPLKGHPAGVGIGIVGSLPSEKTLGEVAALVKGALRQKAVRMVGTTGRKVRKVALCGGSGGSLLPAVWSSGAQLFITGDIKFHDARAAEERKLSILDVGHFAPERYGMFRLGEKIARELKQKGWNIALLYAKEKDPFTIIT